MPGNKNLTTRRAVYETLRQRIVSLDLAPGSPLYEKDIATEMGVSRTPVREALILLGQDGLVQVFPKVGSFVSRIDLKRVADAQFLREAVELAALEAASEQPDSRIVAELYENLDAQREAEDDPDRFFALDEQFHFGLLRLAGHEGAWPPVVNAKAHLDRARRLGLNERGLREYADQHEIILKSLLADGAEAAKPHLKSHLRTVFKDIETIQRRSPKLFASPGGAPVRRNIAVWE